MIAKQYIGATIKITKNGLSLSVTIVDDESLYGEYKSLGLDFIFESCPTKMTFPKHTKRRKKKSDSNLPDADESSSIDTNGENEDK